MAEILIIASTAMQAVGAIQQGNAANAQAKANAQAAQYNANLKVMQAGVERQQAGAKEEAQRRRSRQMLGAQRAAIAQAGIGLGGSALDIAEQSELMAELDSLTIRYEGELRAKGLLAQADMDRYSADVYKFTGKQAKKDSFMRAGTAVLSGATTYSLAKADLLRIQGTL
jgi:hypothetical protein